MYAYIFLAWLLSCRKNVNCCMVWKREILYQTRGNSPCRDLHSAWGFFGGRRLKGISTFFIYLGPIGHWLYILVFLSFHSPHTLSDVCIARSSVMRLFGQMASLSCRLTVYMLLWFPCWWQQPSSPCFIFFPSDSLLILTLCALVTLLLAYYQVGYSFHWVLLWTSCEFFHCANFAFLSVLFCSPPFSFRSL